MTTFENSKVSFRSRAAGVLIHHNAVTALQTLPRAPKHVIFDELA